jgi:hypothetical protein
MTVEEAQEIAERLADEKGVYGIYPGKYVNHPDDCGCRICFVLKKTDELLESRTEQGELF